MAGGYTFDFGDGSAPVKTGTGSASHHYDTSGTYTIKVIGPENQHGETTFTAVVDSVARPALELTADSTTILPTDPASWSAHLSNVSGNASGAKGRLTFDVPMDKLGDLTRDGAPLTLEAGPQPDYFAVANYGPFDIGPGFDSTVAYELTFNGISTGTHTIRSEILDSGGDVLVSATLTLTVESA